MSLLWGLRGPHFNANCGPACRKQGCLAVRATPENPQTSTVDAIVGTGQHAGLPLPDRDGGRSASTSGSAAGRSVPGEERRPRIRLRRPGPQDWLVLLDEASLLPSLSQTIQQQHAQESSVQDGSPDSDGVAQDAAASASSAAMQAGSLGELLSHIGDLGGAQQLGPGDLARALVAAARLPPAAGQDERLAFERTCRQLLARAAELGHHALGPSGQAALIHSAALLQRRAAGDWRGAALAAAEALGPSLPLASMSELTRVIWALATLRAAPPAAWLDAFCRASQSHFHEARPRQLSLTAWALARLDHAPGGPWLSALLEESEPLLGAAAGRDLAGLAWALGTWRRLLGPLPDSWLAALYAATASLLPTLPAPALGQLAWGLGNMGAAPPGPWLDALAATAARRSGGHAAAAITPTTPNAGADLQGAEASGGEGEGSGEDSGGSLSGLQVVNVMWALAQCRHRPAEADMAALMAASRPLVMAPGAGCSPTDLSTLAWAAGRLGWLPQEAWLDDWLAASERLMLGGRFKGSHYATAALELGRWGLTPVAGWRDVFFRSSAARLQLFTARQLGTLLWGVGRMAAPVPHSWLQGVVGAAADALPGDARGDDVGRLLGGLAQAQPVLPPPLLQASSGVGGGGDTGEDPLSDALGGWAVTAEASVTGATAQARHARPAGITVWAADNNGAVRRLLLAAAPLLSGCDARNLVTVAEAAVLLGVAPPAAFASALEAAVERLQARRRLAKPDQAALAAATQQLAALGPRQ